MGEMDLGIFAQKRQNMFRDPLEQLLQCFFFPPCKHFFKSKSSNYFRKIVPNSTCMTQTVLPCKVLSLLYLMSPDFGGLFVLFWKIFVYKENVAYFSLPSCMF